MGKKNQKEKLLRKWEIQNTKKVFWYRPILNANRRKKYEPLYV